MALVQNLSNEKASPRIVVLQHVVPHPFPLAQHVPFVQLSPGAQQVLPHCCNKGHRALSALRPLISWLEMVFGVGDPATGETRRRLDSTRRPEAMVNRILINVWMVFANE